LTSGEGIILDGELVAGPHPQGEERGEERHWRMIEVKHGRNKVTLRFHINTLSLPQEINDCRSAPVDTDRFHIEVVQCVKVDLLGAK
jgi:hypothetical protein